MNQGAGQQQAALLPGGQALEHTLFFNIAAQLLHQVAGQGDLFFIGLQVSVGAHGAKEAGHHHIQRRGVRGVILLHVLGHEADLAAQGPQVHGFIAEQLQVAAFAFNRVDLTVDELQQGAFAGAVWAKDGHAFVVANVQRDAVEDLCLLLKSADLVQIDHGYALVDRGCVP